MWLFLRHNPLLPYSAETLCLHWGSSLRTKGYTLIGTNGIRTNNAVRRTSASASFPSVPSFYMEAHAEIMNSTWLNHELNNIVSHLVKVVLWVQWPSSDTVTIIAQLSRHHRGTWLLLAALGNKLERVREMKPYLCGPVTKLEHRSCCPKKNCWSAFFFFLLFPRSWRKEEMGLLGEGWP